MCVSVWGCTRVWYSDEGAIHPELWLQTMRATQHGCWVCTQALARTAHTLSHWASAQRLHLYPWSFHCYFFLMVPWSHGYLFPWAGSGHLQGESGRGSSQQQPQCTGSSRRSVHFSELVLAQWENQHGSGTAVDIVQEQGCGSPGIWIEEQGARVSLLFLASWRKKEEREVGELIR